MVNWFLVSLNKNLFFAYKYVFFLIRKHRKKLYKINKSGNINIITHVCFYPLAKHDRRDIVIRSTSICPSIHPSFLAVYERIQALHVNWHWFVTDLREHNIFQKPHHIALMFLGCTWGLRLQRKVMDQWILVKM